MNKRPRYKKYTAEELRIIMATSGYTLLSEEYVNPYSKLEIQCPEGHIYSSTRNCWRKGCRCPECYKLNNTGSGNSAYKNGVVVRNIPIYDTYYHKLSYCEQIRRCPEEPELLQAQCHKCKEWFIPTRHQVNNRIYALERAPNGSSTENNLYCSTGCKRKCSTYKKTRHISMKSESKSAKYTNQELRLWSIEVRHRASDKCEICGRNATEAHHILPKKNNWFFALDPDNGVAVCRHCHHHIIHIGRCSAPNIATAPCTN